jgi:hypothetical protein
MAWLLASCLLAAVTVRGVDGLRSSESEPLTVHKVLNEKNLKGKGAIVYSKGGRTAVHSCAHTLSHTRRTAIVLLAPITHVVCL